MTEPLNQKGAVGLIAEYQCALSLHDLLNEHGYTLSGDRAQLWTDLQEAIPRVGGELSDELQEHAVTQGVALANYLRECLTDSPQRLGLILSKEDVKRSAIAVARPVQLMDFYIKMMSNDGNSARNDKLISRFLSYKWFYPNMRLCGCLVVAFSFLVMYSALFR